MKTLSSGHPGCKSGIDCSLSRFVLNSTLSLMLVVTNAAVMIAATPTLTFDSPSALSAEGVPMNLGSHASPRLVDWNGDGALDLLLAGGDGYIWLFRQGGPANSTDFLAGTRVTASGSPIRVGTGYTGCCLADMDGDGRSDLVAAGNDNRVRYFSNIETLSSPAFGSSVVIRGNRGPFVLPDTVGGRIDVADWDGDGLWDLITGDFNGYLTWYRNTGTTSSPVFGAMGLPFKRSGSTLQEPYNTHPRVFDFNQDGVPDLAFGINWGYAKILMNTAGRGTTDFPSDYLLRGTNGLELNIRVLNGDDTTPDFADLNGDGVLDLISGGLNGRLFFMPGISHARSLDRIEDIMAAHVNDLGAALAANAALRDELFGLHRALRSTTTGLLPWAMPIQIF